MRRGHGGRWDDPAGAMSGTCGDGSGTYSLLVEIPETTRTTVGAIGDVRFDAGWYAYAGSALGPGGFARVERHRDLARGQGETRHWHVDYLLGVEGASVDAVLRTPTVDGECAVATATAGEPVPAFGASDCDCETHLHYSPHRDDLLASLERAHDATGVPAP